MPLINANEITMVTIGNLITTSIKDVCDKKQRAVSIMTVAFINKFQNNCTKPGIIEERIKRLIKNEALKNKPFNGHAFYCLSETDITSPEKYLRR